MWPTLSPAEHNAVIYWSTERVTTTFFSLLLTLVSVSGAGTPPQPFSGSTWKESVAAFTMLRLGRGGGVLWWHVPDGFYMQVIERLACRTQLSLSVGGWIPYC